APALKLLTGTFLKHRFFFGVFPVTIVGLMKSRTFSRLPLAVLTTAVSFWAASCAVALGPGYRIEKQEIRVRFVAEPEPGIHVAVVYHLNNTRICPLHA